VELLLLELVDENPLDLLFIQGTSTVPFGVATCEFEPFKEDDGVFFCRILSSCGSEANDAGGSDDSLFRPFRNNFFPLQLLGVFFPDPSLLPARCALLAFVIQK